MAATQDLCPFCAIRRDPPPGKAQPVTVAFDLGVEWPDGRPLYTLACDTCAVNVFKYQGVQLGKRFTCAPVNTVQIVPNCDTRWRSHLCWWSGDINHEHECSCGDRPLDGDEVVRRIPSSC